MNRSPAGSHAAAQAVVHPLGGDEAQVEDTVAVDVPPDGEMDDALPVRDHHDAGFEIERHERLQDAGYGEHRQRTRHVGLVLQHQLPVAVVSQRTGLEHRRESDLGQGGTQRRLVVHGGVQGRPRPLARALSFSRRRSCES